ncbi:MAG: hypothetical protein U0401_01460 [Anaerolineae bacterium]
MKLRLILLVLLIILTLTAAQYGLTPQLTQASESSLLAATATPTPAGNAVVSEQEQIFQVTVATHLLDSADLHALDERLNQAGTIEAGDAGLVNRLNRLVAATAWPEDLQPQVDSLNETFSQYAEALANDDLEAAKPLATQAHELQHDLSHVVEQWLVGVNGGAEHSQDSEHHHSQDAEHDHSE